SMAAGTQSQLPAGASSSGAETVEDKGDSSMGESVTDVTEIPEWNCVPRHVIQDAASVQSEDGAKSERSRAQ
ncbi:hypothetical protein, partial [Rhodopirellula bahusiensis]|uniref:hypothetical protein n=1 Tax=Rhodopirellula bahusiensis TaxID=2014065 RepID=UPI003296AA44